MAAYDCFCDYDPPDVYRASRQKACRQHKCEECGGPIMPGEQYERVFVVWEGTASTFKTCERCFDLRQWVMNNVPCFCWAHGNMLEDADNAVDDARRRAREETAGLKFGLLRRRVAIDMHNRAVRQMQ